MSRTASVLNIEETIGKTVDLCQDQMIRDVLGVPIPFASPKMRWKMKEKTYRKKDRGDLQFLRENYAEEIFGPEGS